MSRLRLLVAATAFLLGLGTGPAYAASSINTAQPVQGAPYNASPVRLNFGAAANDINALQTLNAGVSAPSNPSLGYLWLSTPSSGTVDPLNVWDGTSWVPIAALDTGNHLWTPPIGGGVPPTIVSAATTDLGSVPQATVSIAGTVAIQNYGSSAPTGSLKVVLFTAATPLVNSASLILPGNTNITQAAGGVEVALARGGGVWQVVFDSQSVLAGTGINGTFICPTISTTNGVITAATGLSGCPVNVPTNAALMALVVTVPGTTVYRAGFYAAGDGGGVFYNLSGSPCSLNSGNGDNGSQVKASNGNCWLAQFTGPADVREWGAPDDGATDAGPFINTAIASGVCPILIPPTTLNFAVATPIVDPNGCLRGSYMNRGNLNTGTYAFPGSSAIICSATVSPCITEGPNSATSQIAALGLRDLIVSRVPGIPTAGTIGISWLGGRNHGATNLYAYNHDTCYYLKQITTASAAQGDYFTGVNVGADGCYTHNLVFDGWDGARFFGGVFGDGPSGYTQASDYVFFTNSCAAGFSACPQGPNTIQFIGTHFNDSQDTVACPFRWGGFIPTQNAAYGEEVSLNGVHEEFTSTKYTGAASKGIICSDSTVTQIDRLHIDNSTLFDDSGASSVPMFNVSANTSFTHAFINNNDWGCSGISLAPSAGAGLLFFNFSNNTGCYITGVSFTSAGNASATIDGNHWLGGNVSVAGKWASLSFLGNSYTSVTSDTATGNVTWSSPVLNTWTPIVMIGATAASTSTAQGQIARTADGGFTATVNIILTSLNSGTGIITITGIPYTCLDSLGTSPLGKYINFNSGFSAVPYAILNSNTPAGIDLLKPGTGAQANMVDTDITATSAFYVSLHCGTTE